MSAGRGKVSHARRLWIAAPAACLASWAPALVAAPASKRRPAEHAWIERSAALVTAAKEHASVGDFRRDVLEHRERLRSIVRSGKNAPPNLQQLHRSMVLTNALLNAASECHAGGRLVCPADLMQQLEAQVRADRAQLGAIESGSAP